MNESAFELRKLIEETKIQVQRLRGLSLDTLAMVQETKLLIQ